MKIDIGINFNKKKDFDRIIKVIRKEVKEINKDLSYISYNRVIIDYSREYKFD